MPVPPDADRDSKPVSPPNEPDEELILLDDLSPRAPVTGGSGKLLFGQQPAANPAPDATNPG